MISAPDRQLAVELINEARTAGARLQPACKCWVYLIELIKDGLRKAMSL